MVLSNVVTIFLLDANLSTQGKLLECQFALTQVSFSFYQKHSLGQFSLFFLQYPIIKLQAQRITLNLLFELLYLGPNFALTLGYLNPVSNNLTQYLNSGN